MKRNIAVAERYVFDLMKVFGRAHYHLSKYECKAAIECLDRLPQSQQMAPSVLILIAKAHYELVEYAQVHAAAFYSLSGIHWIHRQNVLSWLLDD